MGAMINEDRFGVTSLAITPASVAANTTAEQTFTVPGLAANMYVAVSKPSLNAGLGVCNARVSAANTLALTFSNNTAGAIVPASETYLLFWFRPEKTPTAVNP